MVGDWGGPGWRLRPEPFERLGKATDFAQSLYTSVSTPIREELKKLGRETLGLEKLPTDEQDFPDYATPAPTPISMPGEPLPSSEFVHPRTLHPEEYRDRSRRTIGGQPASLAGTLGIQVSSETLQGLEQTSATQRQIISDMEKRVNLARTNSERRSAQSDLERMRARFSGTIPDLPFYHHDSQEFIAKSISEAAKVFDLTSGLGNLLSKHMALQESADAGAIASILSPDALDAPMGRETDEDFTSPPITPREALLEGVAGHPIQQYLNREKDPITGKPMTFGEMYNSVSDYVRDLPLAEQIVGDLVVTGLLPWVGVIGSPALTTAGRLSRIPGRFSFKEAAKEAGKRSREFYLDERGSISIPRYMNMLWLKLPEQMKRMMYLHISIN